MGSIPSREDRQRERLSFKIAATYAFLGASWIFVSDRMAAMLSSTPEVLTQIGIIKGWLYVLVTAILLYNLVSRGIKDLKLSQEAVLRAKEDWERTFDAVPDLIAVLDKEYRIVRANRAMAAKLGVTPEQCAGLTCYHAVHGTSEPPSFCPHRQLLMDGMEHTTDVHEDRLGGEFVVSVSPLFDPAGKLLGSVHVARDITERRLAEVALRESEEKYRVLIETTGTGYVILDPDGRVLDANREYVRLTGHSVLEEILGRKVTEWTAPHDLARNAEEVEKCAQQGFVSNLEIDYINRERKYTPIEINAAVLPSSEGVRIVTLCRDISGRKQVEEALRESEGKYSALVQQAKDGVVIIQDDILRFVNAAIADMLGYAPGDMENSPYVDYVAPESRAMIAARLKARLAGEDVPEVYEAKLLRKDGTTIDVELSASIIQYRGKPADAVLIREITERKLVEKGLKESRNFIAKIIDTIADPVFVKEREHRWILLNDSFCSFMGYTREELVGKSDYDFFPASEADVFWQKDEEVFTSGIENENEEKLTDAKGTTHTIITKKTRYIDASGKEFLVGVIRDVTERKREEELLRESEERFRELAENTRQVFWIASSGIAEIVYVSPAYEEVWGRTCASLYSNPRSWLDAIHPEDLDLVTDMLAKRDSGSQSLEYRIVGPDGSIRWILDRGFPVRNHTGEIYRYAGITADITDLKRAEEEKEKLESQLHHAQKMEAIGTLAGGIAHDFNNILGIIMAYAEIADLDLPKDSTAKRSIDELLKGTHRAKDLVAQILTFSRKSGQQQKPLQLVPIIKETTKLLRATLPASIEIRQQIDLWPGDDLLLADRAQIDQLLVNLATNAAHAMREKGGVLQLTLSPVHFSSLDVGKPRELGPGNYLKLSVEDTGHGMDRATLDRIFDPYFTTKDPGEGTGLGLAAVHGIVNRHNGAITVYSEAGKGTTFHVYLPKLESGATSEAEALAEIPGGNERILLVDDEEQLANAGKERLEHLGYKVTATTSSFEALLLFHQHPDHFDLVITDQTMPQMIGIDLARKIMQNRSDIPIILCTGFSERINEEDARKMGISAFAMKPISLRDIAKLIREVLKTREL